MKNFERFNEAMLPAALTDRSQWVCWRYVARGGRPTKCPFDARSGGSASSTDPRTWSSYYEALDAWRKVNTYEGIGFVFTQEDPVTGIDLDGCISAEGVFAQGAKELIKNMHSYSEISPSGRGVKIFIEGQKPKWAGCKSTAVSDYEAIEVYSQKRYFAVTGCHLKETPCSVKRRQAALDALCRTLWPQGQQLPACSKVLAGLLGEDDSLVQKAGSAANGEKFKRLWEGDTSLHRGDDSAADLALCNILAYWTGNDADRIDRLFRRSGLYRAKWDGRRGDKTYGQMTIAKALELGAC